ncbi:UdgX family uracil-DNA binding protein [Massilia forsythiae]|uniref:Type-4 uracil-DNA glycosylase n=1 Tax=Massilia forsythiae TaxID=2728020 RepID=A0A7Z2VWY1_9BURK|nr:UdgX family uracil-DNA binding protein [Massilia forsythiae]QJE00382.1 UdgX family uracil-DNA binding protein [Massilia forsythiae]
MNDDRPADRSAHSFPPAHAPAADPAPADPAQPAAARAGAAGAPAFLAVRLVLARQPLLVASFAEWREAARALLAYEIAPERVTWGSPHGGGDLFTSTPQTDLAQDAAMPAQAGAAPEGGADTAADAVAAGAPDVASLPPLPARTPRPTPHLPRSFMEMLQSAACCRVPDRWAFLYRVIWRWQLGQHDVQSPADEDGARLQAMVKAVRREEHDMHAYIRFRERPEEAGAPRFVAWYEPQHDVLPQVAKHFVNRMGKVSWMIATPDASVLWDGRTLHNAGPLVKGEEELEDGGEALWLTYYRSIFNPARLNTTVMQQHIQSHRWKNLPEGKIVPHMVSEAAMGARKIGQFQAVGQRRGTTIPIAPEAAQPDRQQPSKLDECRRCTLWEFATQAVPGIGPQQAQIMFVGEQPGDQEDLSGQPFIGPAGQLLDRVCANAGVDRETIYVTNAVKHFKWEPRGKRRLHKTPAQQEIEACHYWLDKELAQVNPTVIVALGATALKSVLRTANVTLRNSLGKPMRVGGRWVVTTYHPSYVLRVPSEEAKREAFNIMVDSLKLAHQLLERPLEEPDQQDRLI